MERFAERYISPTTGRPFSVSSKRNVLDNLLGSPLTAFRARRGIGTVDQWNGDHAAEYLHWLHNELRRDSATITKVRSQLRSFGRFCDEELHTKGAAGGALTTVAVSPAGDFERPKEPPLTHEEATTLLVSAPTPRDHLAIAMLLYTGMRPSELLALDRTQIRLEWSPPLLQVKGSLHNRQLAEGSGAEARDVPLTIGQTLLPTLIAAHLADPQRPANASRLFLSKRSDARGKWKPLTLEGLRAMLFDLGKETGIKCPAYRFRHTFCTWCADAGMPMLDLQQFLGLKSSDMIASYYRGKPTQRVLDVASRIRF